MSQDTDHSSVIVRPPLAWALAVLAGLTADWLRPVPLVPTLDSRTWIGGAVFSFGFALASSAIGTLRKAGTRVETNKPTTAIVEDGSYRFSRNPIYIGMLLGQTGLAIGFDSMWLLATMAPFYIVVRYGVIAREETYLERKFGAVYLDYKSRVRRWI
jgi:protein-S-isoprenylcysteine O-methyltransferase Ste14